ncbi:Uncharacterized protein FKW44_011485 [Caligus rogercresseyi]|uniref:Uncharacterized protein n=1 Tax=Caligus rogercresseyi TaxID=217165 RepID=A0A7T8HI14_CALRO|nr:Uncharacterized protein FKW44_011485 [Caligus rogercresseyi]
MKGMISNSELSWLTSIPLRSVQRLKKSLEDYTDPRKVISREPRPELSTRKVKDMDFVGSSSMKTPPILYCQLLRSWRLKIV